jgi:hypothetical protein
MENELCLQSVDDAELFRVEGGSYDEIITLLTTVIKQINDANQQIIRPLRG